MALIRRLSRVWRNVILRRRVERDLDDEVKGMFDLLVDEKTPICNPNPESRIPGPGPRAR